MNDALARALPELGVESELFDPLLLEVDLGPGPIRPRAPVVERAREQIDTTRVDRLVAILPFNAGD
jgi:hypothetical protein